VWSQFLFSRALFLQSATSQSVTSDVYFFHLGLHKEKIVIWPSKFLSPICIRLASFSSAYKSLWNSTCWKAVRRFWYRVGPDGVVLSDPGTLFHFWRVFDFAYNVSLSMVMYSAERVCIINPCACRAASHQCDADTLFFQFTVIARSFLPPCLRSALRAASTRWKRLLDRRSRANPFSGHSRAQMARQVL
jgi:hypothetical protein